MALSKQIIQQSIAKAVRQLEHSVGLLSAMDCTFWACDNKPENNRIKHMITCSRCQSIILINREIKKLKTLGNIGF